MNNGFINLYKKFLDWEWYDDIHTSRLFIHLLLKANFKDNKWHGINVKRGSLITGRKKLSKETKLSEQQIRTSLKNLQSTNELTIKTTNLYSVISITNYNEYQDINQQSNQVSTKYQPHHKEVITKVITTKQSKKSEKFIPPTEKEVSEYCREKEYPDYSFKFVAYYESLDWFRGKNKMRSWKGAVRYWHSNQKPQKEDDIDYGSIVGIPIR